MNNTCERKIQKIEETEYRLIRFLGSTKPGNRGAVLFNPNGIQELWGEKNYFAGYGIDIDGVIFEFMSIAKGDWTKS
jgi:hypothetical protein